MAGRSAIRPASGKAAGGSRYPVCMNLVINGQARDFPELPAGSTLQDLLTALALKSDRVAVEHNGAIATRPAWPVTLISEGDKFEIVHFVGGGTH
jgi:sulfur carrier protein